MVLNERKKLFSTWVSCCILWKKLSSKYRRFFYFFYSLFYNSQFDSYYFIDTIFDPLFYFIDHYLKYFGTAFVVLVFIILSSFIFFAYILGVPYWYHRSKLILSFAWLIGHWLLINVLWNYFKSLYTLPGFATDKAVVIEATSFCKKCFVPKPPRCHHCSVCNKCILKMDHHCPWLNNCIGHYNFRYFFFFCTYTWLGTIFVMALGIWPALDHWFPQFSPFMPINPPSEDDNFFIRIIEIRNPNLKTKIMLFEAIIAVLLFILLGLLLRYHIKLITNGETSIERCINKKCRKHYAKYNISYLNPYDFGVKQNWRHFLGFDRNLYPWSHILLPSNYRPVGDGFSWLTISNNQLNYKIDNSSSL